MSMVNKLLFSSEVLDKKGARSWLTKIHSINVDPIDGRKEAEGGKMFSPTYILAVMVKAREDN